VGVLPPDSGDLTLDLAFEGRVELRGEGVMGLRPRSGGGEDGGAGEQ
jgi:hypothetical protein